LELTKSISSLTLKYSHLMYTGYNELRTSFSIVSYVCLYMSVCGMQHTNEVASRVQWSRELSS